RPTKIYLLKFAGFLPPIVSSQAPRRNNFLSDETIFSFWCRRPETFADYQWVNEAPLQGDTGRASCRKS
ncbi:MAG: hypothetical protein WAU79_17675, partial [Bradyrhizobium sp.]|uniref:hypothetical protein n=1 Tax=Bradyrhizobium sp. TaxID=376 RepID=UPI003BB041A3